MKIGTVHRMNKLLKILQTKYFFKLLKMYVFFYEAYSLSNKNLTVVNHKKLLTCSKYTSLEVPNKKHFLLN